MTKSPKGRSVDPDEFEELMEEERDDGVAPLDVTPEQLAASSLTVTVASPTPPTNIAYVAYGTPPMATADAALVPVGGAGAPVALTAIATPIGGSGGTGVAGGNTTGVAASVPSKATVAEASGTVVIDTELDGKTQSITVMGAYTSNPNNDHASNKAPGTPATITGLVPASTQGTGGTMNLTVNGTGFQMNSIVYVGGVANATEYISPTQLQAINAPKRTSAGTTPITVVTGGVSTAATNWTFV